MDYTWDEIHTFIKEELLRKRKERLEGKTTMYAPYKVGEYINGVTITKVYEIRYTRWYSDYMYHGVNQKGESVVFMISIGSGW